MADGAPEVGIVVIGRNERTHIVDCIAALGAHRERLVYADSASTDGSAELAAQHGAIVVRLSENLPLTPARGRNAGLKALIAHWPGCRFVQFIDGDSVVDPDWIDAGAAFLRANDRSAVVAGNCIEAFPDASLYNWMCSQEWSTTLGLNAPYGGNAMVRVAALGETEPFRTNMKAGEEAELAGRLRSLGWETWRIDQPMVRHDAAITSFSQWWRRAARGGIGYAGAWRATRHQPQPIYATQLRSALLWVVALPLIVCVMSGVARVPWLLIAIPVAYGAQVARIAARRGPAELKSWAYAAMLMLAKVAETVGIIGCIINGRRLSRPLDPAAHPPKREP